MTSTSGSNIIMRVEDLHLGFFIKPKGQNTIRDLFINTLKNPVASLIKGTTYNSILNGVTFTINKGDRIALIGENGAGKSTLCRAISGFYSPHSGKIVGKPKIRALFDTAHGLYPELTGQENIQIIAKLLYPEKKVESLRQTVKSAADFSELGQHLKLPVRNYSNGMQTRLTLSILTAEPAELLILDEVFEGADEFFQLKIRERIKNMIANSGASILVSHSEATLRAHCNRSLLLRAGKIVLDDSIENCFKRYRDKQIDLI